FIQNFKPLAHFTTIHPITCNNRKHAINPYQGPVQNSQLDLLEGGWRERAEYVDYIIHA
uniref:Uncharacterized protein n=1 Tax=Amphimedon queenslandica TaxID=400682 RepID=A0A1X7USC6_AMPQE